MFYDRIQRLDNIVSHLDVKYNFPMLKGVEIGDLYHKLSGDILNYVTQTNYITNHIFAPPDIDDTKKFKNITPNGLVLPKKENYLEYNIIHRTIAEILTSLNLLQSTKKIHNPINLRLVDGRPNLKIDSRPRASVKLHTDIWAGEFTDTIMIFIPVLGSMKSVPVEFFEPPDSIYPRYLKPLPKYDDGAFFEAQSTKYNVQLENGYLYIIDGFLLHKTIKTGHGSRLSIDFRFLPKESVETDKIIESPRNENYLETQDWIRIGKDRLTISSDSLHTEYDLDKTHDGYANEYKIILCE